MARFAPKTQRDAEPEVEVTNEYGRVSCRTKWITPKRDYRDDDYYPDEEYDSE